MTTVPERPRGANATNPPAQVDLADPAARADWLAMLNEETADLVAAALDATTAPAARDLGRRAARRIVTEAEQAIGALLSTAGHVATDAPPAGARGRIATVTQRGAGVAKPSRRRP